MNPCQEDNIHQLTNDRALAVLEQIRQKSAEGLGARAIVTWLNDQAIPCRGQRWHLTTVRRLLKKVDMTGVANQGARELRVIGLYREQTIQPGDGIATF
jgi:hypothetical protein